MTLEDAIKSYVQYKRLRGVTEYSIGRYLEAIEKYRKRFNATQLSDFTAERVNTLASEMIKPEGSTYVAVFTATILEDFFKMSEINEKGIIVPKLIRKYKRDTLTAEETDRILQVKHTEKRFPCRMKVILFRDAAIVAILLSTGMRCAELRNIPRDVDFSNSKGFKIVGKGNRERMVFLNQDAIEKVRR